MEPDDCDLRAGTSNDVNDNGLPDECEASLRLELGFRAPPWVSMSPRVQGRATAFVQLETRGPRGEWPAIYGWNLRVRSSGCRMAEASVGGTGGDARALGGSRFFGFHREALVPVEGEEESILTAIMVLSFIDASALPRGRARHDLLKLDLTRDSLPGSDCEECTLEFEDVPGTPPVVNQITMDRTARLDFEALRIRFCPMESCEGYVSDLCRRLPFHRGDGNDSGRLDISDALFILAFVFDRGRSPPCTEAADTNNDGALDISDGVLILNHLFVGQEPLAPPGPPPAPCDWDGDPFGSEKDLGCTSYSSC